jgi:hypothetical protein
MDRTLAIRIPIRDSDPYDIIAEIDRGNVDLLRLVKDRFDRVMLNVETGDSVLH